jgi:hypothetical protein
MIKLLLIVLLLLEHARLVLSVQLLLQMRQELRSSILKKCGNHQTELLETSLVELYLENQLFAKTFQDLFQPGTNQLLLEDTLSVINIEPLILLLQDQVNLK